VSPVSAAPLDDVGNTLLESAAHLLASEGPAALTVRRIAAEAGMSTMNVYSRFGGKDGVVERLFLRGFELLAEGMKAAPVSDDPLADIATCGQAYRRFAIEHPTLYSVMFDRVVPDFDPSEGAVADAHATLALLAQRLQRAMDAGLLRALNPMHAAAILWSVCHGVVSLEQKGMAPPDVHWDAVYHDACAIALKGMAA
jgi:AcrR family transcriptional regulator